MAEQKTRRKAQAGIETLGLEIGNKPPQALEAEEAVLGAMLLEPAIVDASMAELTKDCFYDKKNQMIFEAMSKLVNEHTSLDIITVSEKLKALGNLEAVGGSVVLANYSERVGSAAHVEYYIKILKQKTIQRDLISASYAILKEAFDDSTDVDDLIDMAQSKVYDRLRAERCHLRHSGASGRDRAQRSAFGLPYAGYHHAGLAAERPHHPRRPSIRG